MEIRFAQPADVPEILALLRQTGRMHHAGRPDLFRPGAQKYGASAVLALMQSAQTPVFVAAEDGRVMGYCFCRVESQDHDPVMEDYTTMFVEDLCVGEPYRRRHVGTQLYRQIQGYARGRKCRSITLNVWAFNEPARKFYESLGMKPQKIGMEAVLEEE